MTNTSITFPRSLSNYYAGREWRESVNSLLEHKENKYPSNLGWDDQIAYHEAYVAAQVTRLDAHKLILDIWEKCWGSPKSFPNLGLDESTRDTQRYLDPSVIWNEGLYRFWDTQGERYLCIGVEIDLLGSDENDRAIWAGVYVSIPSGKRDIPDPKIQRLLMEIDGANEFDGNVSFMHSAEPIIFKKDGETSVDISGLIKTCRKVLRILNEGA